MWHGVESTLSDTAFPYWPKKERKLKHRHPVLIAELRALHADVICLQANPPSALPAI
jgi:mRNA deadenylase 3'-5' endonuclease subunit Ccr4